MQPTKDVITHRSYDRARFGTHTHSTTCVMSGLALLAEAIGDGALLGRVRAFYGRGLKDFSDQLGWCIENSGEEVRKLANFSLF